MPDWTLGMQQTYEYYEVDPISWRIKNKLESITSSSITRDAEAETLQTATIDSTEEFGEMYIRIYLKTIQNGASDQTSLGTFLIQTPNDNFDGKIHKYSYDAYSPLLELKDTIPPIGYYIPKGTNVMDIAFTLCEENCRAPVVPAKSDVLLVEDFVAEDSETWLSFISDLISIANYKFALDEESRVMFAPIQETRSLQPVFVYDDSNSSILYSDITTTRDLYGIPNVVEVVYTNSYDAPVYIRIVNDDPNSPTSVKSRGREIIYRETSPSINGAPDDEEIAKYAKNLLYELSTLEYTVEYKHGYCPVRLDECVLLSYTRAGFENIKARVTNQSIDCSPGCPVSETAIYTVNLWSE